jgi:type III secretion inner rod protein HrpB2
LKVSDVFNFSGALNMSVPVEAIKAQSVIDQAVSRVPSTPTDMAVDKFNSLMAQQPNEVPRLPESPSERANAVTQFVGAQEAMFQQTFHDVRQFAAQAPGMDVQTMVSRQIELQYQVAMTGLQFNSGVYMAQSSKNGIQTLMKNQ